MSNPLSQDPSQNLLPSTSFSALNWEPQEPNPAVILQSDLLIGHINQNPNITALTPNPSDSLLLAQIEGSIATIDPNITLPNDNSFDGLTGEAMDIVKEQLTQFAKVPNFVEKMNLAFGESWDNQAANVLTQDWLNGDFSLIPPVKFVSSAEIGGANGAFAAATDTIYLSRELLAGNGANPAAVADVLLEEIGHSVDARLNVTDAPGDEGAIFAAVVQDKVLSEGELQGLQSEDDTAKINLSGSDISIEMSQIPMASLNGRLYQSHRGNDNNIYTRSSTDGINWTNWNNNGGGYTLNAPSLAAFNGRLYQSHRGSDNNIYTRSSTNGVNWSAWAQSGGTTQSAPTLAAVNGKLYQSHRGYDNNIYTRSSTNGVNWSGWMQSWGSTSTAPALAGYNGRLYQTHRGFDANKMYTRSSTDGMNWTGWAESGGGSTPSYPTIAEFNGRLYQTHRGYDRNLIYTRSSTDGVNWSGWTSINRSTPTAPSMTAFNGKLYLTHQGLDDKIYMSSSTDGINWGSWIERGGATPTDSDNSPISPPTPDRLNQLGSKSSLTIDEIREYRQLVSQRPEAERAGFYKTLQVKVPYFNQNDNASTSNGQPIGNRMCNVTTLASCLTYLGVKNPNPSKQFEDYLEDTLRANPSIYPSQNGINAREWWFNLSNLAKNLGVVSSGEQNMPGFPSTDITTFQNFVKNNWEPALKQGKAIMAGVHKPSGAYGHIVKINSIDWTKGGLIVDDPFGQAKDTPSLDDYDRNNYSGTTNTNTRGAVNTQQGQNENGIGNDNFWSWSYCAEIFGATWYLKLG
ncbi:hypothetical protein PL10110_540026 [Planktothrix agardhii]|uniref:papain-like cysteine protease family protein n=1 Tax=Planktothrix agardhii TaxID=1160 RepID=UPI001B926472|nr:papain-like cysteine protease family protein [Planktothrix agardhii]CAD0230457.1 hypothetical protein PL10110_540026 [Planktothrix agardhii]